MQILLALLLAQEASDLDFFESKVRPVLVENCLSCHGAKKQKGGLRLDSRSAWARGGDSGPAIVPGKADRSLLVQMVRGREGSLPKMPPDGPLPDGAVADLVAWVNRGAADPRTGSEPTLKTIDWASAARFWSFQPLKPVAGATIDGLVSEKLAEKGLRPAGKADRWTLIRRATFTLTGLPPAAEEVRDFEADRSPDAFAKVVDRLLSSSAYGEHQARRWLDLARYAEDQAHVSEGKLSQAWRYRDWAIEAFNKDVPYARFVKLQIAADLIEEDPTERRALGFLGLGNIYPRPNDIPLARAEQWDDRVDTLTRTFLGLTVSCARCHDHKFDPIPTQDYYSLTGIIASTKDALLPIAPAEQVAAYDVAAARAAKAGDAASAFLQAETDRRAMEKADLLPELALKSRAPGSDPLLKSLDGFLRKGPGLPKGLDRWASTTDEAGLRELAGLLRESVRQCLSKPPKQRNLDLYKALFGEKGVFPLPEKTVTSAASAEWNAEYETLRSAAKAAAAEVPPEVPKCHGVADVEKPADLKVFIRGNPHRTGELAPRRFLRVLAGPAAPRIAAGSGRRELADAIADPNNPLTARVMVNRVWQQHFGRGLVATASNFGALGARASHPELLDTLAARFVSVKALHREILRSETWQRASTSDSRNEATDPENQWLWRGPRRRLTVEELRDGWLAASGALDRTIGGPSLPLDEPSNVRRTVYARVSRLELAPFLRLFDFPDPNLSSESRTQTVLPQQSLFLLNNPFMIERARGLAACASGARLEESARRAYLLALGREPSEEEGAAAVRFLSAPDGVAVPGFSRLERFAQALLMSNAFLFLD
jgi:hypothetical protein